MVGQFTEGNESVSLYVQRVSLMAKLGLNEILFLYFL